MKKEKITGSDKAHKSAEEATVSEHFEVKQTGANPAHHTVVLPKPITAEIADLFNWLFTTKKN